MKQIFRFCRLAVIAALAAAVASCGKADYRDALPADSFMTLSVNLASLKEKSGMGDIEQTAFYARLSSDLEQADDLTAEQRAYLLSLVADPDEAGIDTQRDFYLFLSDPQVSDKQFDCGGGLLFAMGDKGKFERFVAEFSELSGIPFKTERSDGLNIVSAEDLACYIIYNDVASMFYYGETEQAKKLFAQKRSESLLGDRAVADRLSGKNDLNAVISYAGIMEMVDNPVIESLPMAGALRGMTLLGSLNFEQGRVVAEAEVAYASEESREEMEEFVAYMQPLSGELLSYVPRGSIAALGAGLNGEQLYTTLASLPGYGMLLADPTIKQVVDAFDGDLLVAFSGMTPDGEYPVVSLLAEVNDPTMLQTLVSNMGGMPLTATGEGEYEIALGDVSAYFGIKDGVLYGTTDRAVKSALDGTKIETMTGLEEVFEGQVSGIYVDFDGVRRLVGQLCDVQTDPRAMMAVSILGMFDDLKVYGTTERCTMIVDMIDKEHNPLETLWSFVGR